MGTIKRILQAAAAALAVLLGVWYRAVLRAPAAKRSRSRRRAERNT